MTSPVTKIVITALMSASSAAWALDYPKTKKIPHTDEYYGTKVSDPYQWLEQDIRESQDVSKWVESENKVTRQYLDCLPARDKIKDRLLELQDIDRIGTPARHGKYYIQYVRHALANHSVVYKLDSLDGERKVLFNPNHWSADGSTALGSLSFSPNGKYVAYAIQESGSDWRKWKLRDVETATDLPDVLENLKFTGIEWNHTGDGFYYSQYDNVDQENKFTSLNNNMKVLFHKLGTAQSDDTLIYSDPDQPEWGFSPQVTDDGRFLIVYISAGSGGNKCRVMYKDLQKANSSFVDLIDQFDNDYGLIGNDGETFYFQTDRDAPRYRIIAMDINNPAPENWTEVVPQAKEILKGISLVNNQLLCQYLKDVTTLVKIYNLDGSFVRDIELPGVGSASGFRGERDETETFYSFYSFNTPPAIYRYDLTTGTSKLIERSKVNMNPDDFVTKQIFYPSKDGTKVPMFISYKKGIKLDGQNPTLLYGYGGFNISLQPTYSPSIQTWMELGGIYASANLRGGGEYGNQWHDAGRKFDKQNVFDDFCSAAEYLIEQKYTSSNKLAIRGGSNGGLLVGACMTQRPELFAVAIPEVGVMDMLRYDSFTAGRFWVEEYGSVNDSKEMFQYLLGYSPYHNLKPNMNYPATLVATADTDDRVVPGHSFKFAARLQEVYKGDNPVLIRIQSKAGHGSGKPIGVWIDEQADMYAFILNNLKN